MDSKHGLEKNLSQRQVDIHDIKFLLLYSVF